MRLQLALPQVLNQRNAAYSVTVLEQGQAHRRLLKHSSSLNQDLLLPEVILFVKRIGHGNVQRLVDESIDSSRVNHPFPIGFDLDLLLQVLLLLHANLLDA